MRKRLYQWLELALLSASAVALGGSACDPLEGCEYTATCPGNSGSSGTGGAVDGGSGGAGGSSDRLGGGPSSGGETPGAAGSESTGAAGGSQNGGANGGDASEGGSPSAGGEAVEGGATNAGGQGSGGASPCDGACASTLPVCDVSTNTCVECTDDSHCSSDKPACDGDTRTCVACTRAAHCKTPLAACEVKTHACVACVADQDCSGATPVCNPTTHACVGCLANDDCAGTARLCDTTKTACVECLKSTDCSGAGTSRCAAGRCRPCARDADCAHISGKNVCSAGTCVQCTEAASTACGAHSCDPRLQQCTSTLLGSVGLCQKCVSDRECIGNSLTDPDARCTPMSYQGTLRAEAFCLRRAVKTCARPFVQLPDPVASLSGANPEKYCGVDPLTTRCEAVIDLIDARTCASGQASACGCARGADGACTSPGSGAVCGTVSGVANSCTYACGTVTDCPTGKTCSIDQPYCH